MGKSNTRYLCFLAALLAPVLTRAVTLGDIQVSSSQNEPLRASIPIGLEPGESAASVRAVVAPPEDFSNAGIERRSYLRNLNMQVVTDTTGASRIEISSREPINHQQLQFVVALEGPPQKVARAYRTPLHAATQETVEPRVKLDSHHYGPIRKSDSLWTIARNLHKTANVSTEQMVLGLIRINPDVFQGKSFAMRIGSVLTVPDSDLVHQLSADEASRIYEIIRSGHNVSRSVIQGAIDRVISSAAPVVAPPVVASPVAPVPVSAPASTSTNKPATLSPLAPVPLAVPVQAQVSSAVPAPTVVTPQVAAGEIASLLDGIRKERLQLQNENEKVRNHVQQLEQQVEALQEQLQLQNDVIHKYAVRTSAPAPAATDPEVKAGQDKASQETGQATVLGIPVSNRFLLLLGAGSVAVSGLLGILWSTRRTEPPPPVPPPPARYDYGAPPPAQHAARPARETPAPATAMDQPRLGGGLDELLSRLNTLKPVDLPAAAPVADEDTSAQEAAAQPQPVRQSKPRQKRGLNRLTDPNDPATTQYKLDLARTCLQQGDKDLANTLLQDVIRKGKASQRNEALELLQTLSG